MAKKASKKNDGILRQCMTCSWAHLHRYNKNPILATCQCKDPKDVQVASAPNGCVFYIQSNVPPTIEQRYR